MLQASATKESVLSAGTSACSLSRYQYFFSQQAPALANVDLEVREVAAVMHALLVEVLVTSEMHI